MIKKKLFSMEHEANNGIKLESWVYQAPQLHRVQIHTQLG